MLCVCVLLGVKVDFATLHEFAVVAAGPKRGVLLFPEICTVELQLLSTGSPDLEVMNHVFHSLLGAVHANCRNAALLYEQVRLTTSSSFYYPRLSQQLCSDAYHCLFVLVLSGRSQNHPIWLLQHPQPNTPLLYRFVISSGLLLPCLIL